MDTPNRSLVYLLNDLKRQGVIKTQSVYNTMLKVDRADFINRNPYADSPQYIDSGATISAPHMHAYALEYLSSFIKPGCKILDVGSGSGYLTVALSKMMNDSGLVVGIEHIKNLYEIGVSNIEKNHKDLLINKKIIMVQGDGRKGYKEYAPYKCIHVGAAAEKIPDDLINQLDVGGRMMIPVGPDGGNQYIYLIDKDISGRVSMNKLLGVSYVPLTSVEKQLGKFN